MGDHSEISDVIIVPKRTKPAARYFDIPPVELWRHPLLDTVEKRRAFLNGSATEVCHRKPED